MIIECPACATQYDIKATLPPEGRTVRCARCSHVWRATPPSEEGATGDEGETPQAAAAAAEQPSQDHGLSAAQEAAQHYESEPSEEPEPEPEAAEAAADEDEEPVAAAQEPAQEQEEAPEPDASEERASPGFQEMASPSLREIADELQTGSEEEKPGKLRWFGGFRRRGESKRSEGGELANGPSPSRGYSAETIPFPRPAPAGDRAPFSVSQEETHTLEEARAAVRSVFSSLSEVRPASPGNAYATPVLHGQAEAQEPDFAQASFAEASPQPFQMGGEDAAQEGEVLHREAQEEGAEEAAQAGLHRLYPAFDSRDYGNEAFEPAPEWRRQAASHEESEGDAGEIDSQLAGRGYEYEEAGREAEQDGSENDLQDSAQMWSGHEEEPQAEQQTEEEDEEARYGHGGLAASREELMEAYGEEDEESGPDPDAALRAAFALHNIRRDGFAAEETARDARFGEDRLAFELETQLRSNAIPNQAEQHPNWTRRSPAALWRKPDLPFDKLPDEPIPSEDETGVEAGQIELAEDSAFDGRLYRDIERSQEHADEEAGRRRGGGLALAAGWGLFLCAAFGLVGGLLAFRDMAAAALPGLAPIYRTLGMPVTAQPLVFENVQYRWEVLDAKPAIVITGSVRNMARRKVRAPSFVITIKDQDPALDREYSAALQNNTTKIKAGREAEFEIELVAPNRTVDAVELELRDVR